MANNKNKNGNNGKNHGRRPNTPNNNRGNNRPNSRGNRGVSPKEAEDHNDRSDLMTSNQTGSNNDPTWYYTDPAIMEQISRFPMTGIAGQSKINNKHVPSVMRIDLAPNLANTNLSYNAYNKAAYLADLGDIKLKGINLAAQKWWSMLTAASGRGAVYTKNDIAILFGAIGEIISIYEFIRRAFGVLTPYSQRNRSLPTLLLQAMNIDAMDFIKESPNYRLEMNTLIAMINQLPIPSNVAYFAKCQSLYQKVFMDAPSEMAQFYVHAPAYTWRLNETKLQSGSVLEPISLCEEVGDYHYVDRKYQKLSVYIDALQDMVNQLLSSSTYSVIYSDILHVAANSNINLWSFDTIKEDYMVVPEYNEYALTQIHNSSWLGPVGFPSKAAITSAWSTDHYTAIAANEVVCDPNLDVVIQATSIAGQAKDAFGSTAATYTIVGYQGEGDDASADAYTYNVMFRKPVLDLHTLEPDPTTRIDSTRYLAVTTPETSIVRSVASAPNFAVRRINLPDHFVCGVVILTSNTGAYDASASKIYPRALLGASLKPSGNLSTSTPFEIDVFAHHMPLAFELNIGGDPYYSVPDKIITGSTILLLPSPILWDVDCWTALDDEWLRRVNDIAYIGLFDIR